MNRETGEIRELKEDERPSTGEATFLVGEIVNIKGVACKLMHINAGKERLTFSPIPRSRADRERAIAEKAKADSIKRLRRRAQLGQ